jgi:hypothetical protein
VAGVVVSTGDHDNNEAAGGGAGTPFLENVTGMMSPTINLITPVTGPNNHGIDRVHAETTDNWYVRYDTYMGIFDLYADGNVWGHWQYNYPALQANGSKVWSDLISPYSVWYNPDVQCHWTDADLSPLIKTSNPSGLPDSIKLVILREQRCVSFNVTDGCSPTGGHYIDNVSFMLPPSTMGTPYGVVVDIWDWYADAFPANETTGLPGSGAAFDTCAAHIFTGYNISPATNDVLRFVVPGDTVCATLPSYWSMQPGRMDLVFRIYPGPGNYVTLGNKGSGIRQVPTSATAATSGDGSFWGQYMASPGQFSKGTHAGGWNVDTWNSARCDTAELNMFPADGRAAGLSQLTPTRWASMYHEDDPRFTMLGIPKNRCFLIDIAPTAVLTSSNITCSSVPGWVNSAAGYDGNQQTREFTKIIPDGLLTPGSHVQYFFRHSYLEYPSSFGMTPDTNRISPQPNEGPNYDGHRWQEFSILPDRWKATEYGGIGSACMLVVDGNDRRGDERAFIGLADTIGLTKAAKYGAHNGWHCTRAYVASDGSHDYTGETDCGTNPNIAVWKHGGQPGSLFDMYQVKAAESGSTGAARLGSRLANRSNMGYLAGKEDRHGPTPEMLRTYYKAILYMSGDLNTTVLGPNTNMGQDDIGLLTGFLTYNATSETPRGLWVIGNGFVESEDWGGTDVHTTFVTNYLAASLRDASYFALQGMSSVAQPDLIPTSVITTGGDVYAVQNSCLFTNDVLNVNSGVSGATPASHYQNIGANGPYVSGVYAPSTTGHPFITLVDGWDMSTMFTRGGSHTVGRLQYFANVLVNAFGSICPWIPSGGPRYGVEDPPRTVDFLGDVWGNPVRPGQSATVHFGLAAAGRAQVRVYDVAGRLVRTLADRTFGAGEHSLVWDGADDQGRLSGRGVYFVRVSYPGNRFEDARKLILLR